MTDRRAELSELRQRIDAVDHRLIELIAERLDLCRQVAAAKQHHHTAVIQPARVGEVLDSRRQWAIECGVDPDFAEQLFRVLLSETHRIEVAGDHPAPPPLKHAETDGARTALDIAACRIDHVVVAVDDEGAARRFLSGLGFRPVPPDDPDADGFTAFEAGGVVIMVVGPNDHPGVARHLGEHGPGVQHIAIEVLNAGFTRQALADAGVALLTDVVVDADGHEQFFTAYDPSTGVQLGFVSRTGHRVGFSGSNVRALFEALQPSATGTASPDPAR